MRQLSKIWMFGLLITFITVSPLHAVGPIRIIQSPPISAPSGTQANCTHTNVTDSSITVNTCLANRAGECAGGAPATDNTPAHASNGWFTFYSASPWNIISCIIEYTGHSEDILASFCTRDSTGNPQACVSLD
jgi:hypothetical protein